jgi:hypothetical protein
VLGNPFVIDRPLPPEELIDREREANELLSLSAAGHNVRVSAPRRYGKTTLLGRLLRDAKASGLVTVYVDFFGVVSLAEIALRIEEAYRDSLEGALARWYAGFTRTRRTKVRAGVGLAGIEVDLKPEEETARLLQRLLALPVDVYERSGRRVLVIFDEFQALLAASDAVDGLLRSRIQHQREEASYVFAGSHPGLMAELFESRERPLFGQARALRLQPLDDESLAEYIGSRFEATNRDVGVALEPLLDLVRGHPQRAMLAAHHLWNATGEGTAADEEAWVASLRTMLGELKEAFERTWEDLSANQRRVLTAVTWTRAGGAGEPLYGQSTLRRFRLTKGTARDVVRGLLRRGDLEETPGGGVRLVDPLLESWIASGRRAPG